MRARATLGEASEALSAVFGRHAAMSHAVRGVYQKQVESEGGRVHLASLSPMIRRLFEITKLERVFDIHDDEATAVAALIASA